MSIEEIIKQLSSNADRIYNLFSGDEDMDDNKIGNKAYRLGCDHALALIDKYVTQQKIEMLGKLSNERMYLCDPYTYEPCVAIEYAEIETLLTKLNTP